LSAPWLAPLRLLVVLVHDRHALAAPSGGRVERIPVERTSRMSTSSLPAGWLPQIAVYSAVRGQRDPRALQLVPRSASGSTAVLYAMGCG
jgi:hypothetical protein